MEQSVKPNWNSLLVPSVQELAENKITDEVPPRYVRPDQQHLIISEADTLPDIPVIDMNSPESWSSELAKLHLACREWGFFQLVNHGVSSWLVERVKVEVQEFFNLPMSEKKKFWQRSEDVEGFGQAFVVSEDQKLDWGDLFFMTTLPIQTRMPQLKTLELYSLQLKNLAMAVIEQMGKALEMEGMEMRELFEDGHQSMRMNYYPPCPQPDKVIGLTPHSDVVGLTVLLQLSEVEGLQIVTNGMYRSVENRVTVNSEKERLSIATFSSPRYDAEIGPSPSLVTEQNPPQFKRIGLQEYFRGLFNRELHGKSYLDARALQRKSSGSYVNISCAILLVIS